MRISSLAIHRGRFGLTYAIDTAHPGLFLAVADPAVLPELVPLAKRYLDSSEGLIPGHRVVETPDGVDVVVPNAEWQTPEQRLETQQQLQAVLLLAMPARGHA